MKSFKCDIVGEREAYVCDTGTSQTGPVDGSITVFFPVLGRLCISMELGLIQNQNVSCAHIINDIQPRQNVGSRRRSISNFDLNGFGSS